MNKAQEHILVPMPLGAPILQLKKKHQKVLENFTQKYE
jgi:hypothetical protein